MSTEILTEANDLVLIRHFKVPLTLVWSAWADPEKLVKWWGPQGFTCSVSMEFCEGGAYRWTMHGPPDTPYAGDYPITGIILEILPEQSLALSMSVREHNADWHEFIRKGWESELGHAGGAKSDLVFMRVGFEDTDLGMKLTIRQTFVDAAMRDAHLKLGAPEGWRMSFDKLETLLTAV